MDLLDRAVCLLQAWCLSAISNYLLRVTPAEEGLVFAVVKTDLESMEVVEQQLGNAAFPGVPPYSVLLLGRLQNCGQHQGSVNVDFFLSVAVSS